MARVKRIYLISCQMLQFPSSPLNITDPRQICIIHNIRLEIRGKWLSLFSFLISFLNLSPQEQSSDRKYSSRCFFFSHFRPGVRHKLL